MHAAIGKLWPGVVFALLGLAAPSFAQTTSAPTIKIGMTAGLTGYLAAIDRGIADGALLAVDKINKEGGIGGRKLELIIEDMHSEPKDAVIAATKLLTSDNVDVLVNGASSAGNLAIAPLAMRSEVPLVVSTLMTDQKNPEYRWMFSIVPPFAAEVTPRLDYLAKQNIRTIGLLYDQTPYSKLLREITQKEAGAKGMTIVGEEQYQLASTDLGVSIKKLAAAGARAIVKNGIGATTVIAAKNIRDLGLDISLLTTLDVMSVNREAADALPGRVFFVAAPLHVYALLSEASPFRKPAAEFMELWVPKYGDRDPMFPGRGWDAILVVAAAMKQVGSADHAKVRDAIERTSGFNGTSGVYNFSAESHYAMKENPTELAEFRDGKLQLVK